MEEVSKEFEWFAHWAKDVAPLYERLSREITDDEAILGIAAQASEGQPPPNLLFAAVHDLLLAGEAHHLASFYSTKTDDPDDPQTTDPFPPFRDFCLEYESTIRDSVSSRHVQTNAVGRSAVLFPAFKHIVNHGASEPLALVEIGASAGLNLYWDQYRYEYEWYDTLGNPESSVCISAEVRGRADPPLEDPIPDIGHRVGIDLNPLDVTDPEDARWLRALVLPDQEWRFERLNAAIEQGRADPPDVIEGDVLSVLPDVLAEIPDEYQICAYSTLTLYQLSESKIWNIRELLREHSEQRPIHWLSGIPDEDPDHPYFRHVTFDNDETEHKLAEYKAHGEWIRWLSNF